VDPETLKTASQRDVTQLAKLLDNPSDASLSERIGPQVDAITTSLRSTLEQRRIAVQASKRTSRDPSFRTSTDYPLFWIKQIDPLTAAAGSVERTNAESKNAAILEVMGDIVVNMPLLNASDPIKMATLRNLVPADLEAVVEKPGAFRLTDQGKNKFN
jgi:hypothetical protein